MPYLKRDDAEIAYEVYGDGYPVLLFAPGFLNARIERWRTNPSRPGVPQDWLDPTVELSPRFRVVALDIRNGGRSRGTIGPDYGWHTYTADHLALLDHLGIDRCHVMGACIGVNFALAVAEARPGLVSALVLQSAIGRVVGNRAAIWAEFDRWAEMVGRRPEVDATLLPGIRQRMFGGDFLFSVTREFVRSCAVPMLILPGDDLVHPTETALEIAALAPQAEILTPWKGAHRTEAMRRTEEFFLGHTPPPAPGAPRAPGHPAGRPSPSPRSANPRAC